MDSETRSYQDVMVAESSFISRVYLLMTMGLLITGFVALYVASSPLLIFRLLTVDYLFTGLIIGELVLVWYMSARVARMSIGQLTFGMTFYAALNGITLSLIFIVYTGATITSAFLITAGTFGAMSLWGYVTKRDLTTLGHYLIMGLFGVILATVVNYFIGSSSLQFIVSIVGVLVFTGLTAYDTQKLKKIAAYGVATDEGKKAAMMGALILYLDFINLFLLILRVLGRKK